jgi:hypothetical protein
MSDWSVDLSMSQDWGMSHSDWGMSHGHLLDGWDGHLTIMNLRGMMNTTSLNAVRAAKDGLVHNSWGSLDAK